MSRTLSLLPLLALIGCAQPLPTEAEAALQAINDLTSATLMGAEAAKNVTERDSSKSAADPCPYISKEGGVTDFTVSADYGAGCVPDSGLVPVEVMGMASVDYASQTLSVGFSGFGVAESSVDGSIVGSYEGLVSGLTLSLDSSLDFTGADLPANVAETLSVGIGVSAVDFDGEGSVLYPDASFFGLLVNEVVLPYANVATCPIPSQGVIIADADGQVVTVTFSGGDEVEVEYLGKRYDVPLCDYASALY